MFQEMNEVYNFFKKCINNDKLSHAYLIEDNGSNSLAFAFIVL